MMMYSFFPPVPLALPSRQAFGDHPLAEEDQGHRVALRIRRLLVLYLPALAILDEPRNMHRAHGLCHCARGEDENTTKFSVLNQNAMVSSPLPHQLTVDPSNTGGRKQMLPVEKITAYNLKVRTNDDSIIF